MIGIPGIISLVITVLSQAFQSFGIISAPTQQVIGGVANAAMGFVGSLTSGQGKLQDVLAALAAASAMLSTLMADPALPADKLAQLKALDGDVQSAILAYVMAGKGFDASLYAPVQPV